MACLREDVHAASLGASRGASHRGGTRILQVPFAGVRRASAVLALFYLKRLAAGARQTKYLMDFSVIESETPPTAPPRKSLLQGLLDTLLGRDLGVQLADALDNYTGPPNESVTMRRRIHTWALRQSSTWRVTRAAVARDESLERSPRRAREAQSEGSGTGSSQGHHRNIFIVASEL